MKKHLLLSLVAAFIMVLGASAQSNSYSMIIEMANGAKITIGPNDIKNITFMDGQVTVSGESIDDIKSQLVAQKEDIKAMNAQIAALEHAIVSLPTNSLTQDEVWAMIKEGMAYVQDDVVSKIYSLLQDYAKKSDIVEGGGGSAEDIAKLQAQINNLQADITAIINKINSISIAPYDDAALLAKMAALTAKIDELAHVLMTEYAKKTDIVSGGGGSAEEIAKLQAQIDYLHDYIAKTAQMVEDKMGQQTEAQITALEVAIKDLLAKLTYLYEKVEGNNQ